MQGTPLQPSANSMENTMQIKYLFNRAGFYIKFLSKSSSFSLSQCMRENFDLRHQPIFQYFPKSYYQRVASLKVTDLISKPMPLNITAPIFPSAGNLGHAHLVFHVNLVRDIGRFSMTAHFLLPL